MPNRRELLKGAAALGLGGTSLATDTRAEEPVLRTEDGYRGIWYYNQPSNDEYVYKYSGGFATYPQQHLPIAYHAPAANKTFFVYGLNARTNFYFLQTHDFGKTWETADGKPVQTPLLEIKNPALVRDYETEGLLVYMKDMTFDANGHPVVLYLTSRGYESGPKNDPRTLVTARWTGKEWTFRPVTQVDHNYDFGSLYIEPEGIWRIIGATEPGPQPYCTGGELSLWESRDQGATWKRTRQLTRDSPRNHTYPRRPVNAHPDFYALWADGDAKQPSESHLYFTNRACDRVWKLPTIMAGDTARPRRRRMSQ